MDTQVFAQNVSPEESKKLELFIKRRLGARLPADAKIQISGYEQSPIKGFRKGRFDIQTSRGNADIPFMVSQDGVLYEKDLGTDTVNAAQKIERFNPDRTWQPVRDN